MAIDTMLDYADSIVLLGNIGMKFYLAKNEIKKVAQYSISDYEVNVIKKLIARDFNGKLIIP